MSFEPIKRILPKAIQQMGIVRQVTAARVMETAKETITALWGEDKAAFVEPISFASGTLKIASASGSALQELKLWEVRLLNEINRRLGAKSVIALQFVSRAF